MRTSLPAGDDDIFRQPKSFAGVVAMIDFGLKPAGTDADSESGEPAKIEAAAI